MRVITSNPLIVSETRISTNDMYISADGNPTAKSTRKVARRGKLKGFVSKVGDLGQKTGVTDLIKTKLSDKLGLSPNAPTTTVDLTTPTPPVEEPKMSTKKKVIIGVSIALVIGLVVFLATRKKTK